MIPRSWLSSIAQLALYFGSTQSFTVDDELLALRRGLSSYATMHGMRLDIIHVVTADGWKLEVHRVRNMKIFNSSLSTPTYLSHGYGCSSFDYMANPRNESLAFILADRGYDVWAVNYRGNKFSNRRIVNNRELKPKPRDYYKATWQYMAEYDVPAFLDKIIETTGQTKIHLIGQSMGTTILFAFLSENHTYDEKLTTCIAIAPVLQFGNDTSCVIRSLLVFVNKLARVTVWPFYEHLFGARLLTARNDGVNLVAELLQSSVCRLAPNFCALATNVFFQTRTPDRVRRNPHIKPERMALYFSKYPAGVTIMNSYLFARQYLRDPWTKMDYDDARRTGLSNLGEYNQTKPPAYDFTKTRLPIVMYFTRNDIFTGVKTAKLIIAKFKLNASDYEIIDGLRMSHHDTLWGWDARCWIYDSVLARLDSIEEGRGRLKTQYFQSTVPEYVSRLKLEDGCRRH